MERFFMFIDGEWVGANDGGYLKVVNPQQKMFSREFPQAAQRT
jgi:acyl-CoA reductase-like NAD-dependent aldehyde dehydrogenase